ncbi:unnamed protein product [Fusarium venenatum]|uniref:Uncharacterized protein n=1 Tax=Fusarium venenatum TaxID=56646 RepID=A0A2L2TLC3_9HYPO|nr:uncharacterized protein FVRRES_05606 [Fusarium venenatum]CEI61170.1 unnamed protein product [Fusarium venenatum]
MSMTKKRTPAIEVPESWTKGGCSALDQHSELGRLEHISIQRQLVQIQVEWNDPGPAAARARRSAND